MYSFFLKGLPFSYQRPFLHSSRPLGFFRLIISFSQIPSEYRRSYPQALATVLPPSTNLSVRIMISSFCSFLTRDKKNITGIVMCKFGLTLNLHRLHYHRSGLPDTTMSCHYRVCFFYEAKNIGLVAGPHFFSAFIYEVIIFTQFFNN